MGHATFSISNASSVMGLVRIVVGHVMRTNTVPDALATCFKSLKIMWLFSAQAHEIKNIAIQDNIDQHLRRRHSEIDNIFQVKSWTDNMPTITKNRLDPNKALDVCKFATIFGTPTQPLKCDPWLKALLREKLPTFENKLDAITTRCDRQVFAGRQSHYRTPGDERLQKNCLSSPCCQRVRRVHDDPRKNLRGGPVLMSPGQHPSLPQQITHHHPGRV